MFDQEPTSTRKRSMGVDLTIGLLLLIGVITTIVGFIVGFSWGLLVVVGVMAIIAMIALLFSDM